MAGYGEYKQSIERSKWAWSSKTHQRQLCDKNSFKSHQKEKFQDCLLATSHLIKALTQNSERNTTGKTGSNTLVT